MATKLFKPTILCDSAHGEWGKTTFIKKLDALLCSHSNRFKLKIPNKKLKNDILKVYTDALYGNREIIVYSRGDRSIYYKTLEKYLQSNNNVWAILCASRQQSTDPNSTWMTINNIAGKFGFEFYAYSNFHIDNKKYPDPVCESFNDDLANIIFGSL